MTKAEIRKQILKTRDEISNFDKKVYDSKIQQKFLERQEYKACEVILLYASFQSEIDTWRLLEQSFLDQKRVFLPRVEGKEIKFYEVEPETNLILGKYGILEPPMKNLLTEDTKGEMLMVLPGVAFDTLGNRIGYGAGYYDRYLSSHFIQQLSTIALAYDFQVMERLGVEEEHDVKAGSIITPTLYYKFK